MGESRLQGLNHRQGNRVFIKNLALFSHILVSCRSPRQRQLVLWLHAVKWHCRHGIRRSAVEYRILKQPFELCGEKCEVFK